TGGDKDCADFATPEEAQALLLAAGGPTLALHRLDIDGNGIACEVLP
ncbi:MAG: excalibur calcium-binding domain-containing protein, partial [Chloroflexi bacterium]|nr:excalibur calcium-binding domain-containing protein [Chloroflexota bacterium]